MLSVPVTTSNIVDWVRRAATTINALITSQAAYEKAATKPVVDSVTFTPVALPASPGLGLTVLDAADGVLKLYDGTAWRPLF